MNGMKATYGKILVEQHFVETTIGKFELDPEGKDDSIKGTVVAVGEDIKDIEIGDIVVYPRSRAIRVFNEEGELYVVQYLSLHYILPQKQTNDE
jgi:co-chaperonin GroES (HSP10)